MKIGLAGKGGTGKTTISGTLARELGRRGYRVTAIDVDPQPTLAFTLGADPDAIRETLPPAEELLQPGWDSRDGRGIAVRMRVRDVIARCAVPAPDGVSLVVAKSIDNVERH